MIVGVNVGVRVLDGTGVTVAVIGMVPVIVAVRVGVIVGVLVVVGVLVRVGVIVAVGLAGVIGVDASNCTSQIGDVGVGVAVGGVIVPVGV